MDLISIDWLKSTNEDRIGLYQSIKLLVDLGQLDWDTFYNDALGKSPSKDYHDNFRKGINSRKDCARMVDALVSRFPDQARLLRLREPPEGPRDHWEKLIKARALEDKISLIVEKPPTMPSFRDPPGWNILYAGEHYYLQLDSDREGHAICFAAREGAWLPHLLGEHLIVPVHKGRQWLARSMHGAPAPMFSDFDAVFVQFIVFVGPKDILERAMVKRMDRPMGDFDLERLTQVFEPNPEDVMIAELVVPFVGKE